VICTVPLPVPAAGPLIVNHDDWLDAVQAQLGCDAVTVTVTLPPPASNV